MRAFPALGRGFGGLGLRVSSSLAFCMELWGFRAFVWRRGGGGLGSRLQACEGLGVGLERSGLRPSDRACKGSKDQGFGLRVWGLGV